MKVYEVIEVLKDDLESELNRMSLQGWDVKQIIEKDGNILICILLKE